MILDPQPAATPRLSRLVLSRRPGESIQINGPCVVRLVEIDRDRGQVRLLVEAEQSVAIVRTELLEKPPPANAARPGFVKLRGGV